MTQTSRFGIGLLLLCLCLASDPSRADTEPESVGGFVVGPAVFGEVTLFDGEGIVGGFLTFSATLSGTSTQAGVGGMAFGFITIHPRTAFQFHSPLLEGSSIEPGGDGVVRFDLPVLGLTEIHLSLTGATAPARLVSFSRSVQMGDSRYSYQMHAALSDLSLVALEGSSGSYLLLSQGDEYAATAGTGTTAYAEG